MVILTVFNVIKCLSILSLLAMTWRFWGSGVTATILMMLPYAVVYLLSNKNTYSTSLKTTCRALAGFFVSILAIGLLFGIDPDPQAGIGVMFGVSLQYGVIFISEAIIGMAAMYEKNK
ncbi:hypothetical protein [Shewanella sp. KT0246]|uniref:hypothetical protein n=1 Tax=Shewanella sp. KT0246 TaxID=2815912 RepID=UPI001BC62074|nr:hypothetical protein [Shewanella sp. KT0246]GIU53593.1 hypothetical protein TUM4249_32340 [Shewanella sp. KT0246]